MATSKKAFTFRVLAIGIVTIVAIIIILLATSQQVGGATSPLGRLGASVKEAIPFIPGVGDLIPKPCYSNTAVTLSAGDNFKRCLWSPPERYGSAGGIDNTISGVYSCPAGQVVDFVDFTPNLAPTDLFKIYSGTASDDSIKQGAESLYVQFAKEDTISLYSISTQSIKFAVKTGQPQVREFKQYAGAVVKNIYCSERLAPDLEPRVFEFTKFGKQFFGVAPILFENDELTVTHGWRNNIWQTEDQACLDGQLIERTTIKDPIGQVMASGTLMGSSTCTRQAQLLAFRNPGTGKYVLESVVDPNNLLSESNEGNNKRTATYTVIQSGGSLAWGYRCTKSSDCAATSYCEWSKSHFRDEGKGECFERIARYNNCGDEMEYKLDNSCLGDSHCYTNIIIPLATCAPNLETGIDLSPGIAASSTQITDTGSTGTITWGVSNDGGVAAAAQSDAELWLDGVRVDTFKTAAPFAPRSYQEKGTVNFKDKYKAVVKVDINNAVQEVVEENNILTLCLVVYPITYYEDVDGDGYGDASQSLTDCVPKPAGYVDNSDDCNDRDDYVHPGAQEICVDGIDSNCNGFGDESYIATPGACIPRCTGTPSAKCSDFRDITSCIAKKCDWDNLFNFCKGSMPQCEDKSTKTTCQDIGCQWQDYCVDSDGDGYGRQGTVLSACTYTDKADCDDSYNKVYPGYPEMCDGKDNDCNGVVDDGLSFFGNDLYDIGPDRQYPTADDVYYRDLAGTRNMQGVCNVPGYDAYVTCKNNLWQWDYAKTAAQVGWVYETQQGNTNLAYCNTGDSDCDGLLDCGSYDCTSKTWAAGSGEHNNGVCGQYCTNWANDYCNAIGGGQGGGGGGGGTGCIQQCVTNSDCAGCSPSSTCQGNGYCS
ncbi:MAG: hypothetical protein HY438_02740 [DPANN group archaeon]|nr:hypothetical protein [DPANN group archaeon]